MVTQSSNSRSNVKLRLIIVYLKRYLIRYRFRCSYLIEIQNTFVYIYIYVIIYNNNNKSPKDEWLVSASERGKFRSSSGWSAYPSVARVCMYMRTYEARYIYNNIRRYCLHNISSHISSLLPRDKCFVQTFVHDKNTFIYVNVNIQPYLNTRLYE